MVKRSNNLPSMKMQKHGNIMSLRELESARRELWLAARKDTARLSFYSNKLADAFFVDATTQRQSQKTAVAKLQCLESRLADCLVKQRRLASAKHRPAPTSPTNPVLKPNCIHPSLPDGRLIATVEHYLRGRITCKKVIEDKLRAIEAKMTLVDLSHARAESIRRAKLQAVKNDIDQLLMK